MVEEGLVVKFRADGGQMTKSITDLTAQLGRFKQSLQTATDPTAIARLNRAIEGTQARIKTLQNFTGAGGMEKFKKGTADATNALGNLSRVAQDAPYGFIGIANNLNPLLESFQRLQKESGSTSKALSAMLAGLTGPAGIGLALGAVSSLLVAFGDKLFSASEKAKYLSDDLLKIGDSAKSTQKFLQDLSGEIDFLNRISGINIRLKGGTDVDVLNREINRFKFNIQDIEENVMPDLARKMRELITREVNAPIGSDEAKQIQEAQKEIREAQTKAIESTAEYRRTIIALEGEAALTQKRLNEEEVKEQQAKNKRLAAEQKAALDRYNKMWERYRQIAAQAMIDMRKLDIAPIPKITNDDQQAIKQFITGLRLGMEKELDAMQINGADLFRGELDFQDFLKNGGKTATDLIKEQEARMKSLAATVSGVVAPAFGDMFKAITAGEAPLKAFFSSIADSISQLMQQLVQMAIQAAVFSLLFPGAGGFAKIFKGLLGGARPFADGGIVSGPTLGLVGEYANASTNPEVIAPLSKLRAMIADVGGGANSGLLRARGTDLVRVVARTERKQRRGG